MDDSNSKEDKEYYSDESQYKGEPMQNRETVLSEIFDIDPRLNALFHRWRGDVVVRGNWINKFEPLCSDAFINKQLSNVEAVVSKINVVSRKSDSEIKRILHDAVETFILDCVDDESVDDKDIRTMSKSFEHTLELFLGIVAFGHGSKVLQNTMAGVSTPEKDEKKNKTVAEWLKGKL